MSLEDRFAILEMIAQYSYAYDARDAEAFSDLFTEKAVWELFSSGSETPDIRLESREAIRQWAANRLKNREGVLNSRHHQSGTIFDKLTKDYAETRTMILVTHLQAGESAPQPTLSGEYHDIWCKTDEGWKFAHRILYTDQFPENQPG